MRTRLIAECSTNHGGSREWLSEAIAGCAEHGIDICKVQAFDVKHLRYGDPQADWLRQSQLSLDDLAWFADECRKAKVEPLASVFSVDLVKPLFEMGYPAIKIGSGDAMRADLVDACCSTFPTVYVSTGLLSDSQVGDLLDWWDGIVIPVHAVTKYPCPYNDVNMMRSPGWVSEWGYSDHCIGLDACKMAVAIGAVVVEKHLRLDTGRINPWDATVDDFAVLSAWRDQCEVMMGDGEFHENPEAVAKFEGRWTK